MRARRFLNFIAFLLASASVAPGRSGIMRLLVLIALVLAAGCGGGETRYCPPLDAPTNGSVSATAGAVGDTVSYQCDEPYYVLQGDPSRACLGDLSWSGTEPVCVDACSAEPPACDLAADITPAAGCLATASGLAPTRFRVTSLSIPTPGAAKGFDLDCFHTTSTDERGCMQPDRGDGVDNAFASINQLLGALSINFNENIASGIGNGYDGAIRVNVVVRGYDGPDDDCVVVETEMYDSDTLSFEPATALVAAVVEGGVLKATFPSLPLVIPFYGDMSGVALLRMNVERVRVELPMGQAGISGGIVGGHVVWDDGSNGDLASLLQAAIDSLGSDSLIDFPTAANIIMSQLDMYVPALSDGLCDCQAVSVGVEVAAELENAP
jgi:hypothetical protein